MSDGGETIATEDESPATSEEGAPAKRLKFPTTLTVLTLVLLVVWLASFFIPGGRYEIDPETGGPVPGTYHELPSCGDAAQGEPCEDNSLDAQFGLLWRAPPNGLYGIENVENGQVGADEVGFLYGSAQIFFFVLAMGAFITVTMKTGAIQTGIGRLALRFRHSPALLVDRAHERVRPRRHDLRHVGRDARLLRAACAACPRPRLRPHRRRRPIIFLGAGHRCAGFDR